MKELNKLLKIAVSPRGATATIYNSKYQIEYTEKFELPNKKILDNHMLLLEDDGIYVITKDKNDVNKKLYDGFIIVCVSNRVYVLATIFNKLKYLKFNSYEFLVGCLEDINEDEGKMLIDFIKLQISKFVDLDSVIK